MIVIASLFVACIVLLGAMTSIDVVFGENGGHSMSFFAYAMLQSSSVGNMTSDVNSHGMMNSPLSKIGHSNETNTSTTLGNSTSSKSLETVIPQTSNISSVIPSWVKTIFKLYGNGNVSDTELIQALEYLIQNGIIKLG